jgi:pimeloyl-ACP methyl ester carboxylesterase
VLRRHGGRVERAVLVGIEGPDDTYKPPLGMDAAYDRIARMAEADPIVAPAGNLWALRERIGAQLSAHPMSVEIEVEKTKVKIPVGPFGIDLILRHDIGDARDIPVFPGLLHSIDQGDPSVLTWFVQKRYSIAREVPAMSMMMDAASGASATRRALISREAAISRFGNIANFPYPEIEAVWEPPRLDPDFHDPVRSDVPTLFLAGDLDWNTPPSQAEAAARGFSRATLIVVKNAGHEQIYAQTDVRAAVTKFLRGESVAGLLPADRPIQFVPLKDGVAGASHPSVERKQ